MRRCRAPDRPLVSPGREPYSAQGPGTGPRPVGVCGRRDEPVGDAVLHTNLVDLQLHRSGASGHRAPRQTGFAHGHGSAHRHTFESNRFQWAIQSQPDGKTRRQDGFGSVLGCCLNSLVFPPSFARDRRRGADHARERQCGPDIASRPSRECDCHADGRAVRVDDMSIR